MTVNDFISSEWPRVKADMLNGLKPLKQALGNVSPVEFFDFMNESEELASEFSSINKLLKQMVLQEMVKVYHQEQGPQAGRQAITRIKALEIIFKCFMSLEDTSEHYEAEIEYGG